MKKSLALVSVLALSLSSVSVLAETAPTHMRSFSTLSRTTWLRRGLICKLPGSTAMFCRTPPLLLVNMMPIFSSTGPT